MPLSVELSWYYDYVQIYMYNVDICITGKGVGKGKICSFYKAKNTSIYTKQPNGLSVTRSELLLWVLCEDRVDGVSTDSSLLHFGHYVFQ